LFYCHFREAVEEILKEAKRSKELAKDFGALAWYVK